MPKATEAEESTTMSVNMTPSQKAAFDKNLAGMGNDSDSDRETEISRAEEECPYGCKYKTGAIWLMKAHVKRCPKKDDNENNQSDTLSTLQKFTNADWKLKCSS